MFAAMRSRSRGPAKPCLCGGSCECHQPTGSSWELWEQITLVIMVVAAVIVVIWFGVIVSRHTNHVHHIFVNGQDCVVQHVVDSCTSTGACRSHDVAVCPSEK
jgi:hypothetical protein